MTQDGILERINNIDDPETLAQIMDTASKKLGEMNVMPVMTCPYCEHEWVPRVLTPARCPKCHKTLDYIDDLEG